MKRSIATLVTALFFAGVVLGAASPAFARTCSDGKNASAAMWLSVLHPGIGEWHLNGYGNFGKNVPQKKFWLGFLPIFGFPYLHIVSAVDVANCRTDDGLGWRN